MSAPRVILLCAALALSGAAGAGTGIVGGPVKVSAGPWKAAAVAGRLEGRVVGLQWTGRHGRAVSVELPGPRPLSALGALPCPEGEWVELTVELEGGLRWTAGGEGRLLSAETLTLVLESPVQGGEPVRLQLSALTLPEGGVPETDDALLRALEDGLLLVPAREP